MSAILGVPTRKSIAIILVGLVAFLLYLFFFGDLPGFLQILNTLDLKNYALFYSLAILMVVSAVFFDSLIWYYLIEALHLKIGFRRIMLYNWIGNFVEMILPCQTVCGEATRIYLAQKEPNANIGISTATVISSRLLSTFVYTSGLIVGFTALVLTRNVPLYLFTIVALITAGTAAILGLILYVVFREGAAEKVVNILTAILHIIIKRPAKLEQEKESIRKALSSFSEAFRTYRDNPRMLVKPLFFAFIAWICNLLVYLLIFYSLGFNNINILDLATIYSVASTVETLTAGFPVGAVEITLINMFSLFGVPVATAAAATTLSRLITFWCQVLIGYPLINFFGLKSSLNRSSQRNNPATVAVSVYYMMLLSCFPKSFKTWSVTAFCVSYFWHKHAHADVVILVCPAAPLYIGSFQFLAKKAGFRSIENSLNLISTIQQWSEARWKMINP